jgi:hypothetical protein
MASNQTGNFCRNCGTPFGPDTVFCGNCGTAITSLEGKTASPFQQSAHGMSGMSGVNNPIGGPQRAEYNTPPLGQQVVGSGSNIDPNASTIRQATPGSNVNYNMPPAGPISSGYLPNVPPQEPQTSSPLMRGFYQAPPPPQVPPTMPPKKSSPRKLLILITACLLIILIAGGGLFAYAYQLGKNNTRGTTTPGATATSSTGQTAQTPVPASTQTTPATSLTTTPGTSATSTPDTSATATPTTVPVASTPGTVLYTANFTNEASQWSAATWSIINGTLINDGNSGSAFIVAPYQPTTRNYALVVTLATPSKHCNDFYVVARATSDGSGDAADYNSTQQIRITTPGVSSDWYTYSAGTNNFTIRLEVQDITSKMFLNGSQSPAITLNDTSRTDPGIIGLNVGYCQVQVFSFQVIAL